MLSCGLLAVQKSYLSDFERGVNSEYY